MNMPIGGSTFTPESFVTELVAEPSDRPQTIVLQPNSDLSHENSRSFERSLVEALELATEGVIVDLLWVDATDADGVLALVAGLEMAACLGKVISFQAMNNQTRIAMEAEWDRQRQIQFGDWSNVFEADLEQFLDTLSRHS